MTYTKVDQIGGITLRPLHPTFAAEASGVDFEHVTQETVDDIKAALAKVSKVHATIMIPSPKLISKLG